MPKTSEQGMHRRKFLTLGHVQFSAPFIHVQNKLNYGTQVLADHQLVWTWQRIPESCCRQVSSCRLSSHTGTLYWFCLPGSHYLSVYTHARLYIFVCLSAWSSTHPTVRSSALPYILLSVCLYMSSLFLSSFCLCMSARSSFRLHVLYNIWNICRRA